MRGRHLLILIFFPILLFSQGQLTVQDPALHCQLDNSSFTTIVLPNLKWIVEENNDALSVRDIQEGNYKDALKINAGDIPIFEIKAHTSYWTHFQLSSKIDRDTFGITFTPNGNGWPWEFTFKEVNAHIYKKGKKIRTAYSGSAAPYSKRDFPEKLDPSAIWLKMNAADTIDVWLELTMASAIQAQVKMELVSKESIRFSRPANFYFSTHHFLNGVGFALLFLALALFIWFRDPIYWWFMIVQIFLLASTYFGEFNNETYLMFFKENPRSFIIISTFLSLIRIVSVLQFGRVYIDTKIKFPRIHFFIGLSIVLFFMMTLIGVFSRIYSTKIGDLWLSIRHIPMGFLFFLILCTLLYLSFSKDKFARVFSFGILITFIFTLLRLIIINISDNPGESVVTLTNHGFMVLTTTIILAYRFVIITQEKRSAQKEKLMSDVEKIKQKQLAEQKTREAKRLEELDRIKSNFFSNITHEFRTPLTLIIEPLRQVIEQPQKPWLPKVELAKSNSQKLLQLVNQLLDLSKLESEKMHLEYKRGNITELIEPMVASFSLLAKEKGIELNYSQKGQLLPFDFDADKMEKIMSNLISNAIKFTPEKGEITIEVASEEKEDKSYFLFSIQDSGIGISKKEQEHIFDRFYQVDGSNKRKQQGTGIGLSLCKELVELMNGQLRLESELGQGSIFEVCIPMLMNEVMTETSTMKYDIKPEVKNNYAIPLAEENTSIDIKADNLALIIEDNAELRQFIRSSIEDHYQVIEAENGKQGVRMALEFIPNIIISDVMMPEMDGFEACKNIKTNRRTAHIPLILLTSKTAMDSRIQGLEYGADVYMSKPFNTKELLLQMKNLIEVRRMLQEKFSQQLDEQTLLPSHTISDKELKSIESSKPIISEFDKEFLKHLNSFLEENIEEDMTIEMLAHEMAMSRTQLFRKLKGLLNQSPSEFVRNFRLNKAKQFLEEKKGNVSQVAYMVGFSNQKYFSTKFKEKYGLSPNQI